MFHSNTDCNEGRYIVDDNPKFKDSTLIKIDYFSEDEMADDLHSRETSKTLNKCDNVTAPKLEPSKSKFYHPLKERLSNRINTALFNTGAFCTCGITTGTESGSQKHEEIMEFIKVLTNGTFVTQMKIEQPQNMVKPKRGRGRPSKKNQKKQAAYSRKSAASNAYRSHY